MFPSVDHNRCFVLIIAQKLPTKTFITKSAQTLHRTAINHAKFSTEDPGQSVLQFLVDPPPLLFKR